MNLRKRVDRLEAQFAQLESEDGCPGCGYPGTACRVMLVEGDIEPVFTECASCGRTLNPEGRPSDDEVPMTIIHLIDDEPEDDECSTEPGPPASDFDHPRPPHDPVEANADPSP